MHAPNDEPTEEIKTAIHELLSPVEIDEKGLELRSGETVAFTDYAIAETIEPDDIPVQEFANRAEILGVPVVRLKVDHAEHPYAVEVIDLGVWERGTTVISDTYDNSTEFRPGKPGLVIMHVAGSLRKTGIRGSIVSRERYALLIKDSDGKLVSFFGELYPGNPWQSDEAAIELDENLRLAITNKSSAPQAIIRPPQGHNYKQPDFSKPWVPINGGVPNVAINPASGEEIRPVKTNSDWRYQ